MCIVVCFKYHEGCRNFIFDCIFKGLSLKFPTAVTFKAYEGAFVDPFHPLKITPTFLSKIPNSPKMLIYYDKGLTSDKNLSLNKNIVLPNFFNSFSCANLINEHV